MLPSQETEPCRSDIERQADPTDLQTGRASIISNLNAAARANY